MALTGPQFEAIQAALLDAFDEQGLRQLCRIELNEYFDVIVATGPLKRRVFDLITWADRKGRIPQLIVGACKQNPGNDKLQGLLRQSQQGGMNSRVAAPPRSSVPLGKERVWTLSTTRWLLTAIIVAVLLIVVGLYLGHTNTWGWGPTQNEPTGTQSADSIPTLIGSSVVPTIATTTTNPIDGAVYVFVPAGAFLMGSTVDDPISMENEQPQVSVQVGAFWIMQTEVTNAQYRKCVEAGACEHVRGSDDPQRAQYPVTNVSWADAKSYAEWAGGRLPTESQWEKACRGASGQLYPWGNEGPTFDRANYNKSQISKNLGRAGSYPSGSSPYGALDMAGNVWEWVYGLSQNLGLEPKTSTSYSSAFREYRHNLVIPEDGTHMWRGGAYDFGAEYVRCAVRMEVENGARFEDAGFRVVKLGF